MAVPVTTADSSAPLAEPAPPRELSLAGEGHFALDSPARALQERVATDFAMEGARGGPARQWSPLARMAFMVGTAGILWLLMLAGTIPHIA